MAKRKIIWSENASKRLYEILDFYIRRNQSKKYSSKLYQNISKNIKLLKSYPYMGNKTNFTPLRAQRGNPLSFLSLIKYLYKKIIVMLTQDIKDKINRVIENIPEENLEEVLNYLNSLASKPKDKVALSHDLSKILKEDRRLLERLAK